MRHINTFLPPSILEQASQRDAITHILRASLPSPLAQHTWFAGVSGDTVTLVIDDNSWATPLRFEQPTILTHLANECGITCRRVNIKVSPVHSGAA